MLRACLSQTAEGHAKLNAKDKHTRYASKAVAKAWDADAAEGKRKAMRNELTELGREWEAWNKPRQEAEERANREKEERRKRQKLEQKRSEGTLDVDSAGTAQPSPKDDTAQESSIEVNADHAKVDSSPPEARPSKRTPARAEDVVATAATAAFYALHPSAGKNDTSGAVAETTSRAGRTLRKPKKSLDYKETKTNKKLHLGEITLSDSDSHSDSGSEDGGRVSAPAQAAARASSPMGSRAASPMLGLVEAQAVPVEDTVEGGTAVQAHASPSEPSSTDTSSDSDAGPEQVTVVENGPPKPPADEVPADLMQQLSQSVQPHPSMATVLQAGLNVVPPAGANEGPESPPRPARPPKARRLSATLLDLDNPFKIKISHQPVDVPTPVPASPTAGVHTRFEAGQDALGLGPPAAGGVVEVEELVANTSTTSSASSSSTNSSEKVKESLLTPEKKAPQLGKRVRDATPGSSGRVVEVGGVASGGTDAAAKAEGSAGRGRQAKRAKAQTVEVLIPPRTSTRPWRKGAGGGEAVQAGESEDEMLTIE